MKSVDNFPITEEYLGKPEVKDNKLVKSFEIVMPDLIRHPEHIELTGFRLGRHPGPRSGTE